MTEEELGLVIGRNIRAARTLAGITQDALSGLTGILKPHVSRLEKGTHLPSVATLKKVADALQVPICKLLDADAVWEKTDGPAEETEPSRPANQKRGKK